MNSTVSDSWFMRDRSQADPFAAAHRFPKTPWSSHPELPVAFPSRKRRREVSVGKASVVGCSKILIWSSSCSPIGHTLEVADAAELVSCDSCHSSYFSGADLCCAARLALHAFQCFSPFPCPSYSFPHCFSP